MYHLAAKTLISHLSSLVLFFNCFEINVIVHSAATELERRLVVNRDEEDCCDKIVEQCGWFRRANGEPNVRRQGRQGHQGRQGRQHHRRGIENVPGGKPKAVRVSGITSHKRVIMMLYGCPRVLFYQRFLSWVPLRSHPPLFSSTSHTKQTFSLFISLALHFIHYSLCIHCVHCVSIYHKTCRPQSKWNEHENNDIDVSSAPNIDRYHLRVICPLLAFQKHWFSLKSSKKIPSLFLFFFFFFFFLLNPSQLGGVRFAIEDSFHLVETRDLSSCEKNEYCKKVKSHEERTLKYSRSFKEVCCDDWLECKSFIWLICIQS